MNCSWRSSRTAIYQPQPNAAVKCVLYAGGRMFKSRTRSQSPWLSPPVVSHSPQCQATTASSQTLPTTHVRTSLQSALLSVDKKKTMIKSTAFNLSTRYVTFQFSAAVTVTLPSGMSCREWAALHCSLRVRPDCTAS